MLQTSKIVGFVPTRDGKTTRAFYEGLLGLRFVSEDPNALIFEANRNTIRVAKVGDFKPAQYTVLGWQVNDIEGLVSELTSRGVVFERYPFVQDKEHGIWTTPGGDKVAWFKDSDGNVLSITQHV